MAAILVGDIVGYSAMMEKSEEKTVARLATCQALISERVTSLDGRIFNRAGDATLAEFPSPINALRCAVEIGVALAGADGSDVEPLKMRFGLHLADVAVHGDDLVGDGVNLAARIQQAAVPGSVWVSGLLFDHIRRNSPFIFDDLGERRFKNLSEPIRVYQVRGEIGAHRLQSAPTRSSTDTRKRPSSVAIMPFRVSGGEEDQRFLAEGLTEELIVELGRFRRLSVASRSATFALAESNSDPVSVGDALRVRYVLDGQVRKIGKTIRIGLTLSETEAGSVVWSDKILRPFEDLLDVLDETVSKIAATVAGRMEDAGIVAARRRPPDNIPFFKKGYMRKKLRVSLNTEDVVEVIASRTSLSGLGASPVCIRSRLDLKDELRQQLIRNIPPGKRDRIDGLLSYIFECSRHERIELINALRHATETLEPLCENNS